MDLLKQELEIINDNEEDPFKLAQPTEEDREAAHPAILLVDEDSDADADILTSFKNLENFFLVY